MEKLITFLCNNELVSVQINPSLTVLDFLRNHRKLTGTKEGCREGDCGACTIMLGSLIKGKVKYKSINSCLLPIADIDRKHVVSIEGLNNSELNYIQLQMIDEGGTQCGFCTPGFVVSLTNYFINHSNYCIEDAVSALDGNICRCTGYAGIKRAIENIITFTGSNDVSKAGPINLLVQKNLLPKYFLDIPKRLKNIRTQIDKKKKGKVTKTNIVSGGTDLYVQKWESLLETDIDFVSDYGELKNISKRKNRIDVGGAVTIEEFLESHLIIKYFPNLKEHLKLFGSLPIRNRATIAGNIVNASPIGDMTNILIALNANIHLRLKGRIKIIPLKEFYLGYKSLNKKTNEIVLEISIPIPSKRALFNYEKVSRRTYLDIASVNSSILLEIYKGKIKQLSLSAGGVSPIPLFLKSTCEFLTGKEVTPSTINDAIVIVKSEISPITDARGTKEYKTLLLCQLIKAHFIKLFPESIDAEVLV
jgi:xanthine dehydrogenase small subunit